MSAARTGWEDRLWFLDGFKDRQPLRAAGLFRRELRRMRI